MTYFDYNHFFFRTYVHNLRPRILTLIPPCCKRDGQWADDSTNIGETRVPVQTPVPFAYPFDIKPTKNGNSTVTSKLISFLSVSSAFLSAVFLPCRVPPPVTFSAPIKHQYVNITWKTNIFTYHHQHQHDYTENTN